MQAGVREQYGCATRGELRRFPNQANDPGNTWTHEGDWHDTLILLEPNLGNHYDMRFQAATFGGRYMLHCHVLAHEDLGMMATFLAIGDEGTPPSVKSTQTECVFADDGSPCRDGSQSNRTRGSHGHARNRTLVGNSRNTNTGSK